MNDVVLYVVAPFIVVGLAAAVVLTIGAVAAIARDPAPLRFLDGPADLDAQDDVAARVDRELAANDDAGPPSDRVRLVLCDLGDEAATLFGERRS